MENKSGCYLIGEIEFRNEKINIYYDTLSKKDSVICSWRVKNPDAFYKGYAYIDWSNNGLITSSHDEFTKPSKEDKEVLPQFIIVGVEEITDELRNLILQYLDSEHTLRNKNFLTANLEEDEDVKRLMKIYDEFKTCEDENFRLKFDEVKKIMMKYDTDEYDINVYKTVLIITKGFKEHETIKEIRQSILNRYENADKK